jgi:hypothetical protein
VSEAACDAFSHGKNPYSINVPDIYGVHPDWQKNFYPPDFLAAGPVKLSYSYMPLSFAVAYVGHLLTGDYRIGNLLAISAAGALLACGSHRKAGILAACLLLLAPRLYYVVYNGWTEPVVIVCLAGVIACAQKRAAALPWVFGLLLASKQYMFLAAPAAILLMPRPWTFRPIAIFYLKAIAVALVVTLPLALWDMHAFLHTVVVLPMKSPFRFDSLSLTAAWARAGHGVAPGWIGFVAAIVALAIAIWRAPRSRAGFAAAVAVTYLCFFALAKQAFGNYYFVPIAAMCCIVAAGEECVE